MFVGCIHDTLQVGTIRIRITIYYIHQYRYVINKHNETRRNVIRFNEHTWFRNAYIIQSCMQTRGHGGITPPPNRTDDALQIFEFKENAAFFN